MFLGLNWQSADLSLSQKHPSEFEMNERREKTFSPTSQKNKERKSVEVFSPVRRWTNIDVIMAGSSHVIHPQGGVAEEENQNFDSPFFAFKREKF